MKLDLCEREHKARLFDVSVSFLLSSYSHRFEGFQPVQIQIHYVRGWIRHLTAYHFHTSQSETGS